MRGTGFRMPVGKGMGFLDEPADYAPMRQWLEEGWSQEAEVREVEVEGAMVRYRCWGMDDASKPGLLFVHGFLAHARWWDHIAPHFADRYRVMAIDMTGMGDSGRRPSYSRKQYGREFIAAAEQSGIDRMTIVAHSFGSVSSLHAAKIRPDLVDRVVVIDAHVFRSEEEANAPVPVEKFYPSMEEGLKRYRLTPPGAWPDPDIRAYVGRHSIRETPQGWAWKFDPEIFRNAHRERIRDGIRGLKTPVEYIHAGRSEIVGMAEMQAFLDNMPSCGKPVEIPFSHHHIMIEDPRSLIAALNGLLANPRQALD